MKHSPEELAQLRAEIDRIDAELLRLLNARARFAQQIGEIKKCQGLEVFAPVREELLLRRLLEQNQGPLPAHAIRSIFREIISAAIGLEGEFRVGVAAWSKDGSPLAAARKRFGDGIEILEFQTQKELLEAILQGRIACAVAALPTEKDFTSPVLELLAEDEELTVCAEIAEATETHRFWVLRKGAGNCVEGIERWVWSLNGWNPSWQTQTEATSIAEQAFQALKPLLGKAIVGFAISKLPYLQLFAETTESQPPNELLEEIQKLLKMSNLREWRLRGGYVCSLPAEGNA